MYVCHNLWMSVIYGAKWHDNSKIYEIKNYIHITMNA